MSADAIIDLFCGACGGWSLGMERAGFETVAACEFDPWRRSVFAQNFPKARMYDDVRGLSAERIVSDLGYFPRGVVGSPPCQDASAANTNGLGVDGEKTALFFEAIRIVGEGRPDWCALENVASLRTRGADRVLSGLEAIGYAAWPLVVRAENFGAPHERSRVWIIAFNAARVGREGWRSRRRWPEGHTGASDQTQGLNPAEIGWRARRAWRSYSGTEGPPDGARPACAHAGRSGRQERNGAESAQPEIPEPLRDIADEWTDWNGGLGEHLRLGDGLPSGLARECISAYGDAVLPQITEAIGRSILRTEEAMNAVF